MNEKEWGEKGKREEKGRTSPRFLFAVSPFRRFSFSPLRPSFLTPSPLHSFIPVLWLFVTLALPTPLWAQEADSHRQHAAPMEGNDSPSAEYQHNSTNTDMAEGSMAGHHHHRPAVLPLEEDRAYSEFNHQVAGVFVLAAGALAVLAASGSARYPWARYGWPASFFVMGVFLLVRHDPESWPWGALPLWEAIADTQVCQHVVFTAIVLGIGLIEWFRCRGTLTHPLWGLIFPALGLAAAMMLFLHKHGTGTSAEKIYLHHAIMATAGIIAMIAKAVDDTRVLVSRVNGYLWSGLMMFIGVMLLLYSE